MIVPQVVAMVFVIRGRTVILVEMIVAVVATVYVVMVFVVLLGNSAVLVSVDLLHVLLYTALTGHVTIQTHVLRMNVLIPGLVQRTVPTPKSLHVRTTTAAAHLDATLETTTTARLVVVTAIVMLPVARTVLRVNKTVVVLPVRYAAQEPVQHPSVPLISNVTTQMHVL